MANQKSSLELVAEALYGLGLASKREEVLPEKKLREDFNMDSLDYVEAVMELEEALDDVLDEEAFYPAVTVADVVAILDKMRGL